MILRHGMPEKDAHDNMRKWIALILVILAAAWLTPCLAESGTDPAAIAVGDVVVFGRYEQDNDLSNGQEPIEWIVLDVRDGKALLLSRHGLLAMGYHDTWDDCTWETCSLRAWLNDSFIHYAFTEEEQSAILTTSVDNSDAQGFDWASVGGETRPGGNDTQDRVFLLSYAEADRYLGVPLEGGSIRSRVAPTAFAVAMGAYCSDDFQTEDGGAAGNWWLRSPGACENSAMCVFQEGSLSYARAYHKVGIVRPAIWLDLDRADPDQGGK